MQRKEDNIKSKWVTTSVGCPASCSYTGDCGASFIKDEPCRRNPPSPDWIRARDPNKKGNK